MAGNSTSSSLFTPIADAKKLVNRTVNLFAKISEVGLPQRSKGTDYVVVLRIIDFSSRAPSLAVNFFAKNGESLPCVRSAGDIISLHGVETSTNYVVANCETELLVQLQKLPLEHQSVAGISASISLLKNIEADKIFDLICKIIHVCVALERELILFVWDGTDTCPLSFQTKIYNERLVANIGGMPLMSYLQSSYVTDIDNENVPFATLIEFIADQETHRCKCVVRAVASCPWRGEDLRSPCDGHFRIQLTLEDPTARIHAYLMNDDGVKFFGSDSEPDDLTRRMLKLLGANDLSEDGRPLSRNPPWIQCCLMSYYLDENDTWESRRYRIYGTKLID